MKRMAEVIKHLGRKPKNISEYKKIWRFLFGDMSKENRNNLKKQRQRHLSHGYGNPKITKKYCIYCVKERSG